MNFDNNIRQSVAKLTILNHLFTLHKMSLNEIAKFKLFLVM